MTQNLERTSFPLGWSGRGEKELGTGSVQRGKGEQVARVPALFLSEGGDEASAQQEGAGAARTWGQSRAAGSHLETDCGATWRDGSEVRSHDLQCQLVNDVIFSRTGFLGMGVSNGGLGLGTGQGNAPGGHYGKDSVVEMTPRAFEQGGVGPEDREGIKGKETWIRVEGLFSGTVLSE